MELAIFDFCGTLVPFQSADRFIQFIIDKEGIKKDNKIERLRRLLLRKPFKYCIYPYNGKINKRLVLKQIKGLSKEKLDFYAEEYFKNILLPAFIKETVDLINIAKEKRCKLLLLSAGYENYLEHVKEYFGFDYLIATKICVKNNLVSGKLENNLIGKTKVRVFNRFNYNLNYHVTLSVSDSRSDLPILSIADGAYVISKNKHQEWVPSTMKEIIYE